ncbi:MAG TPA: hypothetical protein VG711_01820 [Phycisphaerales bacterium]|nr:hypothetical protein [Phycisphaerales bacterium]
MGWQIMKTGIALAACGTLTFVGLTSPESLNIKQYLNPDTSVTPAKWKLTPSSLKQSEQILDDLRWTPPRATDAAHAEADAPKDLAVGLTKSQVEAMMGEPKNQTYSQNSWVYDDVTVFFDGYQVTGWMNADTMLHDDSAEDADALTASAEDEDAGDNWFMMHLGYGSIDHVSASRSSSSYKHKVYKSALSESAYFQQNRRTYSNYYSKPNWLRQWSAYKDFGRTASPQHFGSYSSGYSSSRSGGSGRSSR